MSFDGAGMESWLSPTLTPENILRAKFQRKCDSKNRNVELIAKRLFENSLEAATQNTERRISQNQNTARKF
jgi:hypothetical protein